MTRNLACDASDEDVEKNDVQIQVGADCYTHVHMDEYNVYDFSGWVTNHPGGEYNIEKWDENWEGNPGWYLTFPAEGNSTRKIPKHQMSRWYNNAAPPDIEYVGRLGGEVAFRDLPNELKTDDVAIHFGALTSDQLEAGVVVCGSLGEVANDPSLPETFDVRSDEHTVTGSAIYYE